MEYSHNLKLSTLGDNLDSLWVRYGVIFGAQETMGTYKLTTCISDLLDSTGQ